MNLFDLYNTVPNPRKKRIRKAPSQFQMANRAAEAKSIGFYRWPWNLPIPVTSVFEAFRLFVNGQELLILPRKHLVDPPKPNELAAKGKQKNPLDLFRFTIRNWPDRILSDTERKAYAGKQTPENRAKIGDGFFQRILPYVARLGGNVIDSDNWETAVRFVQLFRFAPPDILFVDRRTPFTNAVGPYELRELQDGTRLYIAYTKGMSARTLNELQRITQRYRDELARDAK